MRRCTLLTTLALALAVIAPGAGATTFGADLSVAPNVAFDCTVVPVVAFPVSSGAQTCTWWTTGSIYDVSHADVVPSGGGLLTRARVRVGPTTGPMQIVVLRSLRHPQNLGDPGCCFPVGASAIFMPAPNGITEVPMNVQVRNETDPATGINNVDHIAISVLAPGVPIPAYYTGDQYSLSAPSNGGFYPAYVAGTERSTGLLGFAGFEPLINADVEPLPASAPPPPTQTGPVDTSGLVAPIALGGTFAKIARGSARVPLVCGAAGECAGLLRLQSRPAGGAAAAAAARRPRLVTYGRARFAIPAGGRARVKVRLNEAGRQLLADRAKARVYANVTLDGRRVLGKRLTLRD